MVMLDILYETREGEREREPGTSEQMEMVLHCFERTGKANMGAWEHGNMDNRLGIK